MPAGASQLNPYPLAGAPIIVPDTLRLFVESVSRECKFLEERGFRRTAGADEWLAEVVFERHGLRVRVVFGGWESEANVLIQQRIAGLPEPIQFALWEWLDALGVPNQQDTMDLWITTEQRLTAYVQAVAAALRAHLPTIERGSPELYWRLSSARTAREAEFQADQQAADLRRASARASQAFWSGAYASVVTLLSPFERELGKADQAKLSYARRKSSGAPSN